MSAPGTNAAETAGRLRGPALGIGLVLLAAVLWSTSGLFIKLLTVNSFVLTGVRSGIAAVTLLPFSKLRALRVDATMLLLIAAFSATQLCFVFATRWTTAANAIAMQSTAPAWVFMLTALWTRRVETRLLPPLALIALGIAAILSEPSRGTSLHGNLLALFSGLTFAISQMCLKRVDQPAVGAVMLANAGSFIGTVLIAPGAFQLAEIPAWEWLSLIYLGAAQIGLGMFVFTVGLRYITVHQASVLSLLEPLLNPVWVFLVLGELPSGYGFAGYALILSGILSDFWIRLSRPPAITA